MGILSISMVSIPYRYAKNTLSRQSKKIKQDRFQFLIGTLKTQI